MTALNWLHLTDWHIGQKDEGLWPNVKDLVLKDLRKLARAQKQIHGEPWDVVLFTGDLAFSGKESQYKQASVELENIWRVFREEWPDANAPVLLCVPGNHDLDRTKAEPTVGAMRDSEELRKALFEGNQRMLDDLEGPFAEYTKWWEGCPLRPQSGLQKGLLPGEFSYGLEKGGVHFVFVGLNTAFLDVNDESEKKLWLDVKQLHKACGGSAPDLLKENTLAFLITHHPPDWLSPEAHSHYQGEMAVGERFVAHICGHLHEAFAQEHRRGFGKEHRLLQGVSIFGLEKLPRKEVRRKHGYTSGRLFIDDDGQPHLTLWPRLAVRLQDDSWRLTADYTYELENDLSHTPSRPLDRRIQGRKSVEKAVEASLGDPSASLPDWRTAAEDAVLWKAASSQTESLKSLRQLAGEIAGACWRAWGEADAAIGVDPWRDEQYPLRVLAQLERFLGNQPGSLSPAEALVLVTAPFVREGVRACGVRWMKQVDPEDLTYTSAATEPRNTLEQVHLARPDLFRRAERIESSERRSLVLWMMHRALDRLGSLWQPPPWPTGLLLLENTLSGLTRKHGAPWLTWTRLTTLARCIGAGVDLLEAEGGPATAAPEELPESGDWMRSAALAYLLCASGWSALDPCLASEVAIDHVGIESSFRAEHLRQAFRKARWERREKEHILSLLCHQPVIDFVLKELVSQADEVLAHVRHRAAGSTGEQLALLRQLPTRLSAADVKPASDTSGIPLYRPRHVRFRLDHDRIRELLMGEQLYRNPTMALRELYQNALDACRYRRARQEYLLRKEGDATKYVGLISFRQGVEGGRPFIECTDNGVGMTEYDLERVFAVAGKRFVHTPEYIEERAAWSKLGVELYPNSQFGIGVLSYFMLADELQITTRRFRRDGRWGQLLDARISSASGLFRLTEKEGPDLPEGGTRVRLFLGESRKCSARASLGEFLRVAEFRTEVHDEKGHTLIWQPGVLGNEADHLMVDEGHVWLNAKEQDGLVLADGIATDVHLPLATVNLHGKLYPRLSVDRQDILTWDSDLPALALERGIGRAAKWQGLSMNLLWAMDEYYPKAVSQLHKLLAGSCAAIPLRPHDKTKIVLKRIGCFIWDSYVGLDYWEKTRSDSSSRLNAIERWRIGLLEKAGLIRETKLKPLARAEEVEQLLAQPGDSLLLYRLDEHHDGFSDRPDKSLSFRDEPIDLLNFWRVAFSYGYKLDLLLAHLEGYKPLGVQIPPILRSDYARSILQGVRTEDWRLLSVCTERRGRGRGGAVHTWDVLRVASVLERSPQEVARRLSELAPVAGLHLDFKPEDLKGIELQDGDLPLLSYDQEGSDFWLKSTIHAWHVLQMARKLERSPQEVARRLSELAPVAGLHLDFKLEILEGVELLDGDLPLLSWNLDGRAPWLEGTVPTWHVLLAARKLERSPPEVARRLSELAPLAGFRLNFKPEALEEIELQDGDWELLSWDLLGRTPWVESTVPVWHVLQVARRLGRSPQEVARRLSELAPLAGFRLSFKPETLEGVELQDRDWRLLSRDLDGRDPWVKGAVPAWHILQAARGLGRSPLEVAHRLSELAPLADLQLDFKPEALERVERLERNWRLLSSELGRRGPLSHGVVHVWHVLRGASRLKRSPLEVARRFSELAPLAGLQLGFVPDAFADSALQEANLQELASLADLFVDAQRDHANTMAKARLQLWWLTDIQVEQMLSLLMPLLETGLASKPSQDT